MNIDEQIAAVRREIRMREHVYPRRVQGEQMTQAKADHETEAMQAVLATLEAAKAIDKDVESPQTLAELKLRDAIDPPPQAALL